MEGENKFRRFFYSLRFKLILIVLLALLPAFGLVVYNALEQRRNAADSAREEMQQLASLVAVEQENLVESARQLLATLAQVPGVREADPETCSQVFGDVVEQMAPFDNLSLVDPWGGMLASVLAAGGPVNIADRPYFQELLRTRDFTVAGYLISRVTGDPILQFAYPLLEDNGDLNGVITTRIDLGWMEAFLAGMDLPPHAVMTVVDEKGAVLARYPHGGEYVGEVFSESPLIQAMRNQPEGGSVSEAGIDGVRRLYAIAPLSGSEGGGATYMSVGVPESVVYSDANKDLTRSLIILGLVAVLILLLAWAFGDVFVLRRVRRLVETTGRLGEGDLEVRSNLPRGHGELDRLAGSIDDMAESLGQKSEERERAEESLGNSEARFRELFDNMSSGVAVYEAVGDGEDFIFRDFNKAAERIDELKREDLIDRSVLEVFPGIRDFGLFDVFRRVWRTGEPERHPVTLYSDRRISGWRDNYVYRLPSGLIVAVYDDVTERKRAEEALRKSEESYRGLAESISDVFFAMDKDLRYTYWNRASEELTGIPAAEALGKSLYDLFPDIREMGEDRIYREVLDSGEPYAFVNRYELGDKEFHFEISVYPTPIGIAVLARDITDRKRSEDRLTQLNSCLLDLGADPLVNINSITCDGIHIMGVQLVKYLRKVEGEVSLFRACRKSREYEAGGETGEYEIFAASLEPLVVPDLEGTPYGDDDPDVKAHGMKSMMAYPVMTRGQAAGWLCFYDDTERDFSREEMEIAGMLARAVSIEEERWADEQGLRDFIDIASHELRHPITIMKGYADTMMELEDRLEDRHRKETLVAIDRGADRLNALLMNLLDTSRIERGKLTITRKQIPLEVIVETALSEMKAKGLGNTYRVRVNEGIGRINVDSKKVAQLLVALLDNASKFSPRGSEIDIEAVPEGEQVVISVMDRGEGVPEEERQWIFDRFYQVGDARYHSVPGIGLGLYIAKQIARAHGGELWHEPREGGGSIFRFSLPVN